MTYTLAFDVYGTLINTSGVYESLQQMIGDQAQPFMDTWRQKQLEYSFRRAAMNQYVDFSICTQSALEYCCLAFGIQLSPEERESLMALYKVLPVFPDVAPGLQQLKAAGHRLFAFSNGSSRALFHLLEHAGIMDYFDGVVSVEHTKMFKPSPIVYAHFNQVTRSTPNDSWLISSNAFDVIGAATYGMNTVWLKRSPDAVFDPWEVQPTKIIQSLKELHL